MYNRDACENCNVEKRRKGTKGGKRGNKREECHNWKSGTVIAYIEAEILLIITACTATCVLHRLSRTDEILLVAPSVFEGTLLAVVRAQPVSLHDDDGRLRL